MDFAASSKAQELAGRLQDFLVTRVLPAEQEYDDYRAAVGPDDYTVPPVVEQLKREARGLGLWHLFLPDVSGLSNVEYAPLAEITCWSVDTLPEAVDCQAPDTGNMETLHLLATPEPQCWLAPLLEGEIRSALVIAEPHVASSDATNSSSRRRPPPSACEPSSHSPVGHHPRPSPHWPGWHGRADRCRQDLRLPRRPRGPRSPGRALQAGGPGAVTRPPGRLARHDWDDRVPVRLLG